MKFTICLAKTTLIFYSVLAPFIIVGSLYNDIKGLLLHENPEVHIGAFSLFGFILLPMAIVVTYLRNKCVIADDAVRVGKENFMAADYAFSIRDYDLPVKERPLFSLLRKTYHALVIKERKTGHVALDRNLDVFKSDVEKIRRALPGR